MQLTTLERQFINNYQGNFPLQERPFKTIAKQLNSNEELLIETVQQLKDKKLLSRFGPLYDAAQLGGGLTLAAIAVPEKQYQNVTELVNAYPEVAHNYRREHKLNMWFVLATETPAQIMQTLTSIEKAVGLTVYNFPKQQEFYIGLWLHMSDDGKHTTVPVPSSINKKPDHVTDKQRLDDIDRKLINITQTGFAIEHAPYLKIANELGITQQEVLQRLDNMLTNGIIRRIGAVPNHYRLGVTANGMTVWQVDEAKITQLGNLVGQLDFVSHCYQRPQHLPMWRYNLFAMVHGANKNEVNAKVKQIEVILGKNCKAHDTLFSSAILKKTGLRLAA